MGNCHFAPAQVTLRFAVGVVEAALVFGFDRPDEPKPAADAIDDLSADGGDAAALATPGTLHGGGDVLVIGRCYVPDGQHRTQCMVRVELGPVSKELYVSGDRFWRGSEASDPQPFRAIPIDRAHAFGGPLSRKNPLGKGLQPLVLEGTELFPFPNVMAPNEVIMKPGDTPKVAGLGPFPDRPLADQRLEASLEPGAAFRLENLHPNRPVLEGRLPRLRLRCFVGDAEGLSEIPLATEATWLFPHREQGVMIHRGALPDAARAELLVAIEDPDEERSVEHYRQALARRRAGGVTDDADLLPSRLEPLPAPEPGPHAELLARADGVRAELLAHADAVRSKVAATLGDQGVELPTVTGDGLEAMPPSPEDATELHAELEVMRAEAEQQLVAQLDEAGLDGDAVLAKAMTKQPGAPPLFSADEVVKKLRATLDAAGTRDDLADARTKLGDADFVASLQRGEEAIAAHHRLTAHLLEPFALPADEQVALRDEVTRAHAEGRSLAGKALGGADLSGLELAGVDLRGARLECANLAGANLAGADLRRAVLAHANLEGADLRGARLEAAGLGRARLRRANLSNANLRHAQIFEADFDEAEQQGATLPQAIDAARAWMNELSGASPTPTET